MTKPHLGMAGKTSSAVTESRYIVGIDLGTTHTVVAFVDTVPDGANDSDTIAAGQAQIFAVDQLVAPGEVAAKPLLPSFRYHPIAGEIAHESMQLPWAHAHCEGDHSDTIIGHWAQQLGAAVAGRLVASAKSWLSHGSVDRQAAILPWGAQAEVNKISPVLASASYLHHLRKAWNYHHPEHPLEQQQLVITVPASFDESARALTVYAAELAGLQHFVLLEEPQAVVYDWFARHRDDASVLLDGVELMLVCDVGGGTTDLSLIAVECSQGELKLNRIGVGDHLMLGGDNIDLALAHQAEKAFSQQQAPAGRTNREGKQNTENKQTSAAKPLNSAHLAQLIQQCRQAKETLLAEQGPESATVTLVGGGSKLIGGARSCILTRSMVHQLVLDGFFPLTPLDERPDKRKSAIVEFGLPYVSDPAISKHLAEFLSRHQQVTQQAKEKSVPSKEMPTAEANEIVNRPSLPDAVLFNGGAFNSPLITERVEFLLNHWWSASSAAPAPVVNVLDNPRADLAVACGAAAYGVARRFQQLRIGGGSASSYFLLLNNDSEQRNGVCVLPKGSEENQEIVLADRRFELKLGEPVKFHLATTNAIDRFNAGEVHPLSDDFLVLPPLLAVLDKTEYESRVQVNLIASLTEVGTIELYCREALAGNETGVNSHTPDRALRRWKLEFEVRKGTPTVQSTTADLPAGFASAIDRIDEVFGSKRKAFNPQAVKILRNDLVKVLGKREEWDSHLLRELFNALIERKKGRNRSEHHERVWFNLAGFCLRPGYGDPLDGWRIEQVWPLYQQGLQFVQGNQNWSEWWVFWRRLAGGLDAQQQKKIYKDIAKYINPTVLRNRKLLAELKQKSYEDMLRMIASLEHLPVAQKIEVGGWLVKRLEKKSESHTAWWALGRLASRFPFYGSVHNLIPPDKVAAWLPRLLKEDWKKNQSAAFAAVMMCRKTGDRERDLDGAVMTDVIAQLQSAKAPASWAAMLTEVKELNEADTKRVFGEALPLGLTLID